MKIIPGMIVEIFAEEINFVAIVPIEAPVAIIGAGKHVMMKILINQIIVRDGENQIFARKLTIVGAVGNMVIVMILARIREAADHLMTMSAI